MYIKLSSTPFERSERRKRASN
jgi:hypothetical protein